MRYTLTIAILALLVAGLAACTRADPTLVPVPTPLPSATPTLSPTIDSNAPTPVQVASPTRTPAPEAVINIDPTPQAAVPTRTPAPAAVLSGEPTPPAASPTPTPATETPEVLPTATPEPPEDTPVPPTPVPTTVPPSGPSSPELESTGSKLTGRVDLIEAQELFSQRGMTLRSMVEEVSVFSLEGSQVAVGGAGESFSFDLPPDAPYLLKAKTEGGAVLWALTPVLSGDVEQDISLESTYQAGLIYAAQGQGIASGQGVDEFKKSAKSALDIGADRLVNTVIRGVNNALLWQVDYSIVTEMDEVNLRAFGGCMSPVRTLASILDDPQPDYVPHIYMLNTAAGEFFLDRILMSEMKADRWAAIVVAEDIPPRVYRGLGGLHVVHGGKTLAYGEDKCFEWTGQGADRECRLFRQVLVSYPLDAPAGVSPTVLTSIDAFDGANRPQWSWDEKKIAFDAFPEGRLQRAQIYVMDRDGGSVRQLTSETNGQNGARSASWSPDNSQIVYVSDRESFSWDIWLMNADGSEQRNLTKGRVKFPNGPKFSPDGRRILFYASDNEAGDRRGGPDDELWIMAPDGGTLTKITSNDVDDENAVWGLNGVDVVYSASDRTWEASDAITGGKLLGNCTDSMALPGEGTSVRF